MGTVWSGDLPWNTDICGRNGLLLRSRSIPDSTKLLLIEPPNRRANDLYRLNVHSVHGEGLTSGHPTDRYTLGYGRHRTGQTQRVYFELTMITSSSDERWSTAQVEIMQATYRALLEHGYADLSISRIADELDKSKAALYYHYDSKDDLLVAFLEFAVDKFEATIGTETGSDPNDDLEHVIEKIIPLRPSEEERHLREVMVGLRSQAVTNVAFREQFTRLDEQIVTTTEEIIERGIDEGAFRDVDPTRIAEHIQATINGTMYARATTDRENAATATRVSLLSYIDSELRRHQ